MQALIQTRRHGDLAMAFAEAWNRGPSWREAISIGLSYIQKTKRSELDAGLREGLSEIGEEPEQFGLLDS